MTRLTLILAAFFIAGNAIANDRLTTEMAV